LQSNRIRKIENLYALESLEELYLSHNGIEKLENLEHTVRDIYRLCSDGKLKNAIGFTRQSSPRSILVTILFPK
jgi:protein phosphatase 1 regulatory subunit 7